VREAGVEYVVNLAVPCRDGIVMVDVAEVRPGIPHLLHFTPEAVDADPGGCLAAIQAEVKLRGGLKTKVTGKDAAR
jgi:hypothetical protein